VCPPPAASPASPPRGRSPHTPLIVEPLSPIAQVEKIRSAFALKQVRCKTALPLRRGV
jgi:hypothetical protein